MTTTDGGLYVYTGAGSKTDPASYVQLADITPTIAAVEWLVTALGQKLDVAAAIALLELAYSSIPTAPPPGIGKLWLNAGVPTFTVSA